MKFLIKIAAPFLFLWASRVIYGLCESYEVSIDNGIVKVDHPHGPFALPYDKFSELIKNGFITVEPVIS
jgi:hypothetical protein